MDNESPQYPPVELWDLATGYQRSKTLFALVEFGLPTLLSFAPLSQAEVARSLNIHKVAADRFLNACIALNLIERVGEKYRNTPLAETFLVKDKPAYLGDHLLKYDSASYPNWINLAKKLREWQPGASPGEPAGNAEDIKTGLTAQHNLSLLVGQALGKAYDFSIHKLMLDLGGGTGAMSLGICETHRELHALVLDLPPVAEIARVFVAGAQFGDRIEVLEGSFAQEELPASFDVVLLANLLSMASEQANKRLLGRLYNRLPDGGAVILSGWILDDGRTTPVVPVLFCLEDINYRAPDVERSASTYIAWLQEAGFVDVERRMYCAPTSMIVGRKRYGA